MLAIQIHMSRCIMFHKPRFLLKALLILLNFSLSTQTDLKPDLGLFEDDYFSSSFTSLCFWGSSTIYFRAVKWSLEEVKESLFSLYISLNTCKNALRSNLILHRIVAFSFQIRVRISLYLSQETKISIWECGSQKTLGNLIAIWLIVPQL